ncbi:Fic family protein [Flavihumibacter cheonanensis]|uniref:Fic family protein n=1 Tax=Flavihumibacter cheonanensis TaxID=1442385 RepID=UPI001EF85C1F|nr:Fic family protein [Flavihumibacter cheonanensis]MCG7754327.1 Fic family protein [Flavihumibacter cheonanensis]
MKWIWERPDWPNFRFDAAAFIQLEREFHRNTGLILGSLSSVSSQDVDELQVTILSNEALDTSKIEGEILDRDSVQSSIRGQLGLQTDGRRSGPKETGVSRMMVDLYRSYNAPLNQERLFSWHQMLMNGRIDLEIVGGYRVHEDPMQIVSGRLDSPQVFYEAPPSHKVPKEMENYLLWFNRAFREGMPTLVHAGLAHLFFELIHPFEDGNGRIGRAIAEKALAMGARHPLITSLSSTLEQNKKAYYQALQRANDSLEVTDWLVYFSGEVLKAQINVRKMIQFIVDKARYFEDFRNKLNERQTKVALRLFREGPEGFKGGLSAENYIRISKTSPATATRDLAEMVALGALKKTGKLRHTRYYLPMVEI